jgi:hypothetical protein
MTKHESTEWGLRYLDDNPVVGHRRGQVENVGSEKRGRQILASLADGKPLGWGRVELVSRTVVTESGRWTRVAS